MIDLAWTGLGQVQWSHEFDLVACGFISSLVSAESLPFTFVSWPLFCSSVKHPHPCFPPRNESKVYRGYFAGGGGVIYLFFRRFALGWISIYIRSYWIFFPSFLAGHQQLLSLILFWIPFEFFSFPSESFSEVARGAGVGGLSV